MTATYYKSVRLFVAAAMPLLMCDPGATVRATTIALGDGELPANIDFSFDPELGDFLDLRSIAVQADGKILLSGGGLFIDRQQVALMRLDPNGTIDRSFRPPVIYPVNAVRTCQSGKLIVLEGNTPTVKRLLNSGAVDDSFLPSQILIAEGKWLDARPQKDDKVVLWSEWFIRRLNEDGSPDAIFNDNVQITLNMQVGKVEPVLRSLAAQPDGKLLVNAGEKFFRLNLDGSLDTSFSPLALFIWSIFPSSDGKIVTLETTEPTFEPPFNFVRRFSDGTLEGTLFTLANSSFAQMLGEIAGQLYLRSSDQIFRLHADGTIDPSFAVAFRGYDSLHALESCATIGGSGPNNSGVSGIIQEKQLLCWRDSWACYLPQVNGSLKPLVRIVVTNAPQTAFVFPWNQSWVDESARVASITVQRVGSLNTPATIHYETTDGTAHAGEHYVATHGTVAFAPLERAKAIDVPLIQDKTFRGTPQFFLHLSEPSLPAGVDQPARITIFDNQLGVVMLRPFRNLDGSTYVPYNLTGFSGSGAHMEESADLVNWKASEVAFPTILPDGKLRFYRAVKNIEP
jgi:uncharacterized delta-60 repeat protein